jgi:hypothetical protein
MLAEITLCTLLGASLPIMGCGPFQAPVRPATRSRTANAATNTSGTRSLVSTTATT